MENTCMISIMKKNKFLTRKVRTSMKFSLTLARKCCCTAMSSKIPRLMQNARMSRQHYNLTAIPMKMGGLRW